MLQTFLKDKPYAFIPLLEQCEQIDYNEQSVRENCIYSGKLRLKITVRSPLHIGSGLQDYDKKGNVIKKQMHRNGKIIIPGSSLKGAVRTVAEAVSYSCAVKVPNGILQPILPEKNKQPCTSADQLCMTCYIFGMMNGEAGCRGRVQFGEFTLESGELTREDIPNLQSPFKNYPPKHDIFHSSQKCSYGNERLYYCRACEGRDRGDCGSCTKENYYENRDKAGKKRNMEFRGRKFYSTGKELILEGKKKTCYEMIAPGSVLKGEIMFQNLRQEEGKLLAYALNIKHFFCTKLGYGKPLGYGKVKIDLESAESMGARYPSVAKIDRKLVERWAQEYRSENTDQIKSVVNELERIMGNEERFHIADSY